MNIHGHNIKECSQTEHHHGYRLCKLCAKYVQTVTVQVYTKLVYWLIMKGMYMDGNGTLPRLGYLNSEQNVYNLLLYKCTQIQFTHRESNKHT